MLNGNSLSAQSRNWKQFLHSQNACQLLSPCLLVTFLRHPVVYYLHLKSFQHESNVVGEDCQEVHHVERGFQEGDLGWYWRRNNFCYRSKLPILSWCKRILEMKNLFWCTGKTDQEFWKNNHWLVYFMLKQNWVTSSRSKEEITLMNLLIT